jgi:gliding motility-associated-like protein
MVIHKATFTSPFFVRLLVLLLLLNTRFPVVSAQDYPMAPAENLKGVHRDSTNRVVQYTILPSGNREKRMGPGSFLEDYKYNLSFASKGSLTSKTFTVNGAITVTVTTISSTCGYANGSIIAAASGGVPPYSYNLIGFSGGDFKTGNFPRLTPGPYKLKVTDATGQSITTDVAISNTFSPVTVKAISYKLASGCTTADASVTLQASGGSPPYEYSMDGANYQSSGTFTNFYAGLYGLFARDANGCIGILDAFNLNDFINPSCGGTGFRYSGAACGKTADITLTGYGPNPPYTYSIDGINYQTSGDFTKLGPGIYTTYFKDATGAIQIVVVQIYPSCTIQISYISVDAACGQNDGTLTVTASNGTAPYTYTIDGINYQSSNVFSNLAPGAYNVTVRDADGITNSLEATVYDRCPTVTTNVTNEGCAKNDGIIKAVPNKGTPPYEYSIDGVNFQNSTDFTGLTTGNYTITLRDANGFTATAQATIKNACILVSVQSTGAKCGNKNGGITVSASNGIAPYQYSLDGVNFQSSNVFTGLASGSYAVTVKDWSGKSGNATVSISDVPPPQISVNVKLSSCADNDGSLTITGTDGALPYSYSLDGSRFQTTAIFSNLKSGSYSAFIKDGNGCVSSKPAIVDINCPIVSATITDETCNSKNGIIQVSASKGTAPYEYSIDGVTFTASQSFSSLYAGDYIISVKDALGITNTTKVSIKNICPAVNVTVTDGKCTQAGGVMQCEGNNGYPPYQYSLDGINYQPANVFTGLSSGQYTVTIKDSHGLTNTAKATVQNFPSPELVQTINAASCLNNDGQINASNSGGTAPFTYSIDGTSFQSNGVFSKLHNGSYTVTIKDGNGCTGTQNAVVELIDNLTLSTDKQIELCEGGSAKLNVSSNASAFSWSPSIAIDKVTVQSPVVSPAQTTTYTVAASLGICNKKDSVLVIINKAPIAAVSKDTTICYGQSVILSGFGGISYIWSPAAYLDNASSATPLVMSPKSSISYSLKVTDAKGCTSLNNALVKVNITPPAKLFAGNDTVVVMNQPFQLKAQDINNSGFVDYSWSPPNGLNNSHIQNPIAGLDHSEVYTVVAKTLAGCQGSDEIAIKVYKGPDIYVPTAFTPNGDGLNDILRPIVAGIKEFKYFAVYNRWGQTVFYSSNQSQGWDGTFKGKYQTSGVFIWLAEGIDDKGNSIKRKGTVVLIK